MIKKFFILVALLQTISCTSVRPMPADSIGLTTISSYNVIEQVKCAILTTKETIDDGFEGKWARHWFRMSYIGKTCERQYGRTTAVILESIFAIPHYFIIAVTNSTTALGGIFIGNDPKIPS